MMCKRPSGDGRYALLVVERTNCKDSSLLAAVGTARRGDRTAMSSAKDLGSAYLPILQNEEQITSKEMGATPAKTLNSLCEGKEMATDSKCIGLRKLLKIELLANFLKFWDSGLCSESKGLLLRAPAAAKKFL